jgi:hypothetical protein
MIYVVGYRFLGGTCMTSENNHLQALKAKHAALDAAINEELSRPLPDEVVLATLKRQKLKLKEEIELSAPTAG